MDHPNQLRKVHSHPIPLVGGLAIWSSITVSLWISHQPFSLLWLSVTAMGIVGLIDDWVELSALPKFFFQILVAVFLWYFGSRITLFVPSKLASLIFTIVWFVWVVNAFNYIDNSNGLCGGIGAITLGGLAIVHFLLGDKNSHLGFFEWIGFGSILGFLCWNFPKARIFLGDSGSHFIGAVVAVLMMQTTFVRIAQGQSPWVILTVPFFILVPFIDFVQVTIGRFRRGQPIWQGDANHLSHILMRAGWSSTQAILILWLIAMVGIVSAIVVLPRV